MPIATSSSLSTEKGCLMTKDNCPGLTSLQPQIVATTALHCNCIVKIIPLQFWKGFLDAIHKQLAWVLPGLPLFSSLHCWWVLPWILPEKTICFYVYSSQSWNFCSFHHKAFNCDICRLLNQENVPRSTRQSSCTYLSFLFAKSFKWGINVESMLYIGQAHVYTLYQCWLANLGGWG